MANTHRTLIKTIRTRQLKFFGHVMRKQGLEHLVISGKIEGKRDRGRQRMTYTDSLRRYVNRDLNNTDFIHRAGNREDWRNMIVDVCLRPDT